MNSCGCLRPRGGDEGRRDRQGLSGERPSSTCCCCCGGCSIAAALSCDSADASDGRAARATAISWRRPAARSSARSYSITVGGQSYPGCGTVGDGYAWAKSFGHKIVNPRPALVPLTSSERWVAELSGVTIPDVLVQVAAGDEKPCISRRASFLFTHFGLSGPAPMDVSRAITERPQAGGWRLDLRFRSWGEGERHSDRLAAEAAQSGKKVVLNILAELAPRRLAERLHGLARRAAGTTGGGAFAGGAERHRRGAQANVDRDQRLAGFQESRGHRRRRLARRGRFADDGEQARRQTFTSPARFSISTDPSAASIFNRRSAPGFWRGRRSG